jgi:hypothetical protein
MPGRSWNVKVRASVEISGSAAAVCGFNFTGRAR